MIKEVIKELRKKMIQEMISKIREIREIKGIKKWEE